MPRKPSPGQGGSPQCFPRVRRPIATAPQWSLWHCCKRSSRRPHHNRGCGNKSRSCSASNSPTSNARLPQIGATSMYDIVQIQNNVVQPAATASWRDTKLHTLHRDYETRSQAILKTVGTYKYATDSSTTVLCCAYTIDDEPVQLWTAGDAVPVAFVKAATNPAWVVAAHNDAFETAIEQYILAPRYCWPVIPVEQHRCTMAAALAAGLPAKLSTVA